MRRLWRTIAVLVALALAAAAPLVASLSQITILTSALVFVIFAVSLDLQLGYAGLPSLGHAAFFGFGAYAAALLYSHHHQRFELLLGAGVVSAALLALVLGPVVLRVQGLYYLMITLAVSQVLWGIAFSWRSVTNGDDGIFGISRPHLGDLSLVPRVNYYYFVLAVAVVVVALVFVIAKSPFGYALVATRENERRSLVLGYSVFWLRYLAFVLSGAIAGLAGVLFMFAFRFVGPSVLGVDTSGTVLLMVIVGGAGTVLGPVLGAIGIEVLHEAASGLWERWLTVMGIVYVLVALFLPHGLVGLGRSMAQRIRRRA